MTMRDQERLAAVTAVVTSAVNQTDPMGLLSIGAPEDEYEPEIRDLLEGLAEAWPDPTAVLHLCEAVFTRWFGANSVDRRRMKRLAGRIVMGLRGLERTR